MGGLTERQYFLKHPISDVMFVQHYTPILTCRLTNCRVGPLV